MNKQRTKLKLAKMAALLLCIGAVGCAKKSTQQVPEAKVEKGVFYIDIYEEGEIEAINSINVNSPNIPWRFGNLKISDIVEDGASVKEGDTLITFDPSEVRKAILDYEDRLIVSNAELEKMIAQQELEMEQLIADYEVTRISHEITRMQLESAAHESEIKRREIQLNLDKADISLDRAKEQIENRRKIQAEEMKQKHLSIRQDEERLEEAHLTLNKLFVIAPAPGIAIISRNWSTNSKFQMGDQCWSSQEIIKLPDLSKLKAKVNINEIDISKVTRGLKVQVRPDAFSDSIFSGYVSTVANLAQNKDNKSNIKVFPVEIVIDQSNKNLLPGLTVSCRIIVDEIPDVLYMPIEALHVESDKSYVFKKTVSGYEKVEVQTGHTNSDYVIIESGLDKGDKVALIDPATLDKNEDKKEEKK
ncbi:MAG: efflux RND transporter periplasmic adaptor subunit [Bacteroidaceae bacterium]|nr:efflux RND transporter periplasmic adaptor subunit [Bacteroidaceae bacterium]